jgi:hypothetical protein
MTLHAAGKNMSEDVKCPYVVGRTTLHCSLTPFTLTAAEREAIQRAIDSQQHRAAEMHSRSWVAALIDDDCDTLRGLLERTK